MSDEKLEDFTAQTDNFKCQTDMIYEILGAFEISIAREEDDEDFEYEYVDGRIGRAVERSKSLKTMRRKQKGIEEGMERRAGVVRETDRRKSRELKKRERTERENKRR